MKINKRTGISLIVLVITIMIHFDKWRKVSKIGKFPPKNKLELSLQIV